MKSSIHKIMLIVVISLASISCEEDWLDVKRDLKLIVPTSLNDMKLLLRDEENLSRDNINLLELSADDYYIPSSFYAIGTIVERNAYVWADDVYEGQQVVADWNNAYYQIEVANVILDGLAKISRTTGSQADWDNVKGSALHLRGKALFYLVQTFAPQYDAATALSDLGVPVRTSSDPNVPTVRNTVQETYTQILADFEEASTLLKDSPEYPTDPSRFSAYGYLARCYLVMGNYNLAVEACNAYLQSNNSLLDYNTLNATLSFPIPRFNIEVTQHAETSLLYTFYLNNFSRIHNDIYESYDANDLRKKMFFRDRSTGEFGTHAFKGSYTGSNRLFSGISTNEIYLIRAESNARKGNVTEAMDDLNALLVNRWVTGTYVDMTAETSTDALNIILTERRKELLRRGARWSDLRRLNKDSDYATTITRTINGTGYSLEPNDLRYVMPIPEYVIASSGITQNPR